MKDEMHNVELMPDDLRDIDNAAAKITIQEGSVSGKAGANDRSLSGKLESSLRVPDI